MEGELEDEIKMVEDGNDLVVTDGDSKRPMSYYFKQRDIKINLVLLTYMWSCVSFCYYMVSFLLKYLPGDIYENTYSSTGSELASYLVAAFIFEKFKLKPTSMIGYGIALIGGLLIIFLGETHTGLMPIFVILAKFGICMNFVMIYTATSMCFPSDFTGTAYGIVNLFARAISIGAPQVAEVPDPIPMIIFSGLAAGGLILTPFIR